MTSAERIRRKNRQDRWDLNNIRGVLNDVAATLLSAGKKAAAQEDRDFAKECFVNAEAVLNSVKILDARLKNYEHEFEESPLPNRRGFERRDPRDGLVMAGEDRQAEYADVRAARRPAIARRYGVLAKSDPEDGDG